MSNLPLILESGRLRLSFHRHGDRIAHTIGLIAAGRLVPLLASVEGTPDDLWPPSPPLQTVDTQSRGECFLAMLVGMAGQSHWSASVEASPTAGRLTFDVACRIKELPESLPSPGPSLTGRGVFMALLGSAYRSMVVPRIDPAGGLIFDVDGLAARIDLVALPAGKTTGSRGAEVGNRRSEVGGRKASSLEEHARLSVTSDGFEVLVEPGTGQLPRTVRWGYVIARVK